MTLTQLQTESIELSNLICKLAGHPPIHLVFKGVKSYEGKAFLPGIKNGEGYISIANGLSSSNKYYREAIVIHEVCHFLYYRWYNSKGRTFKADHHGIGFKRIETYWLKEFGMYPLYAKAYWHTLLSVSGDILWSKE